MMYFHEKLFRLAKEARENAYAPYSKFKVSAAIWGQDNKQYVGCNVENVSYPCGTCAEAGAISEMVANGCYKISEILILADSKELITPCGGCLQRISEFSDEKTIIHLANLEGVKVTKRFSEFFTIPFKEKDLKA